jgi:hypothetical protein
MKTIYYTLLFLFFYSISYNQSLKGTWKGHSEHSIFVLNPTEIILEVEINNDTLISGSMNCFGVTYPFKTIEGCQVIQI